jgi:DNA replication and repair protein RecF
MAVARLVLTDFRNHREALLAPGPGLVVLTGDNGAGKTNVLEAVSLLSPGRGLRGASLSEMARIGGPGGFAVSARLGEVEIGTGAAASAPERRLVRINGAPAAATALSEWLSVLWLTPAMDRLFQDSAGGRRRFLDRLVLALEPGHAHHSARYEAAMRARNKLLSEERWDETWLDSLEAQMAEHGAAVSLARLRTVEGLTGAIRAETSSAFPRARLGVENVTETDLAGRLRDHRRLHSSAGRSTHGPNNEDLLVHFGEDGRPASLSSTGEQKALLLSIVLAHADLVAGRSGRRPILLLDEVAAHLDPRRRSALFERLQAGGGQVWMTGTEAGLFDHVGPAVANFQVADGAIL